MTVEEAIGLCKCAAEDMDLQKMPRFAEAVRLGREALKKVQAVREGKEWVGINPLPGETEEDPPGQ